jgi:hypothetical protein
MVAHHARDQRLRHGGPAHPRRSWHSCARLFDLILIMDVLTTLSGQREYSSCSCK